MNIDLLIKNLQDTLIQKFYLFPIHFFPLFYVNYLYADLAIKHHNWNMILLAQDHRGNQLYLGINHSGILTFQGSRKTHHFKWSEVHKINFEGRMFIVHLNYPEVCKENYNVYYIMLITLKLGDLQSLL